MGVAVHRLAEEHSSLEQVYLDLTGDSVQYRVSADAGAGGAAMSATFAVRTAEPGTLTVFGRAAAAEWVRLRTVRTTWWCLLAAAVTILGIGATMAFDADDVTGVRRAATGDGGR